jgi:hypothetical protein
MGFEKVGSQGAQDPVGIFHLRGVPGAVGVGLPHRNVPSNYAVGCGLDFVVAYFRVARIAEETGVDKRKVSHIQKVLDDPRAVRLKYIRTRAHFAK